MSTGIETARAQPLMRVSSVLIIATADRATSAHAVPINALLLMIVPFGDNGRCGRGSGWLVLPEPRPLLNPLSSPVALALAVFAFKLWRAP